MNLKEMLSRVTSRKGLAVRVVMPIVATGFALVGCSKSDIGETKLVDCTNGPKSSSATLVLASNESVRIGPVLIRAITNPGRIEVKDYRGNKLSKIEFVPGKGADAIRDNGNVLFTIPEKPRLGEDNYTEINIYDGPKTLTVVAGKPPNNKELSGTQLTILASCLPDKK